MRKSSAIHISLSTAVCVFQAMQNEGDAEILLPYSVHFDPEKLFDFVVQYNYTAPEILLRQIASDLGQPFTPEWLDHQANNTAMTLFAQTALTLAPLISSTLEDEEEPDEQEAAPSRPMFEKIGEDASTPMSARISNPFAAQAARMANTIEEGLKQGLGGEPDAPEDEESAAPDQANTSDKTDPPANEGVTTQEENSTGTEPSDADEPEAENKNSETSDQVETVAEKPANTKKEEKPAAKSASQTKKTSGQAAKKS
jgi:hypothetical protein